MKSANFFLQCANRRCSQIKPQLKVEIEDGNTWVPWGLREIKIAIFYLTYCFLFYKSGYAIIQTKNFLSGDPI